MRDRLRAVHTPPSKLSFFHLKLTREKMHARTHADKQQRAAAHDGREMQRIMEAVRLLEGYADRATATDAPLVISLQLV